MFVIQSGEVEIVHYLEYDGVKEKFIIEKLFRGSVINHNSFLMKDGIDTDAICKTSVSVFQINIDTIMKAGDPLPAGHPLPVVLCLFAPYANAYPLRYSVARYY